MNFLEKYIEKPDNYILQANGGYGKTTILKYIAHEIRGKRVDGRVVIPIYIRMVELNTHPEMLEHNFFIGYLKRYFNNSVSDKAILEMIENFKEYDYLLILDGYNEVNNYLRMDGQTVYKIIENSILKLYWLDNVHFIISIRNIEKDKLFINKDLLDSFSNLKFDRMKNQQIREYLNLENLDAISNHLREILGSPFFLKMFKRLLDEDKNQAVSLRSKYDLMKLYFERFEVKEEDIPDNIVEVRKYVLDYTLPLIGVRVVLALMNSSENELADLQYDTLLDEVTDMDRLPDNINISLIRNVMKSMNLFNEDMTFSHQLVGEFFCFRGIKILNHFTGYAEKTGRVFYLLEKKMDYIRNGGMDFIRRTQFLNLAEFIYGGFPEPEDMVAFLIRNAVSQKEAIRYAEAFYQNLAGLYDDLLEREFGKEIGWKAVSLLEQMGEDESAIVLAEKYNFLYYSVNKAEGKDPFYLLERAKVYSEKVPKNERTLEYHELVGRIISNYGSYYVSKFCTDLNKAVEYHMKALEYRKKWGLSCMESYRTLMSDYWKLEQYDKAYDMYKKAIYDQAGKEMLFEVEKKKRGKVPVVHIAYAMGSEIPLLQSTQEIGLKKELTQELIVQMEFVYDKACESNRIDIQMLKELRNKLTMLLKRNGLDEILRQKAEEYLVKCKEHF